MSLKRKYSSHFNIWPAYADVLASVLMILTFVLMTFVISQLCLNDSILNKDHLIRSLNEKIADLEAGIKEEKSNLKKTLDLMNKIDSDLEKEKEHKNSLLKNNDSLQKDLETQLSNLKKAEAQLLEEVEANKKNVTVLSDLKQDMQSLEKKVSDLSSENKDLAKEKSKYEEANRVTSYRSEFFAKLKEALGDMEGIKVVGDRFIFQSELLFDVGSDELGQKGEAQLKNLSQTLKEIAKKIPENINWILRVDGHTDKRPIKSTFASNWELSAARAIAVVKFLIGEGISAHRLVAAGFGEYQPLEEGTKDEKALARNRRIELKLDQR